MKKQLISEAFRLQQLAGIKLTIIESKLYKINHEEIDEDNSEEFIYYQANYLIPQDDAELYDPELASDIIMGDGTEMYRIDSSGIDPSTDGDEIYYTVNNTDALKKLAKIYGDDNGHYRIADKINKGIYKDFMILAPDEGDLQIFIVLPKGLELIEKKINKIIKDI